MDKEASLDIKHSVELIKTYEKTKIINKTHFLIVDCKHEILTDYVDITPDKGCNIKYCSKCGKTF
jgi:hypothetical protein